MRLSAVSGWLEEEGVKARVGIKIRSAVVKGARPCCVRNPFGPKISPCTFPKHIKDSLELYIVLRGAEHNPGL